MTLRILPAVLAVTLALAVYASPQAGDDTWLAKIRRDHPRMFFNADTWPAIKAHTLSDPAARAQYEKLLRLCDGYPEKPVCSDFGPVNTPPSTPIPPVKEWGAAHLVVLSLKRVAVGALRLPDDLKPGEWRDLSSAEVEAALSPAGSAGT